MVFFSIGVVSSAMNKKTPFMFRNAEKSAAADPGQFIIAVA